MDRQRSGQHGGQLRGAGRAGRNHIEILRQWAAQLEQLNRQLRELERSSPVQQRIRDVMGNPTAAGAGYARCATLDATDLARTYGDTLAATRRLANAVESLRRTSDGIYRPARRPHGASAADFVRQEPLYRRYAAVERQADTPHGGSREKRSARSVALQGEIAASARSSCAARRPRRRWTSTTPSSPRSRARSPISTRSDATKRTSCRRSKS
jgi:hypothetical protein